MKYPKLKKPLLNLLGILWTCALVYFACFYQSPLQKRIRHSAEDVQILSLATYPPMSNAASFVQFSFNPVPFNDFSRSSRLPGMFYVSKWEYILAELQVRGHMTRPEVLDYLHRDMDRRRIASSQQEGELLGRLKVPLDPFGASGSSLHYYRLGMPPGLTERERYFVSFLIVGNGPDGDADVDETRFNAEPDPSTGKIDPCFGLGKNPVDLLYDPTNGIVSNGDIFLLRALNGGVPGPKPLWDEQDFKKRYGL